MTETSYWKFGQTPIPQLFSRRQELEYDGAQRRTAFITSTLHRWPVEERPKASMRRRGSLAAGSTVPVCSYWIVVVPRLGRSLQDSKGSIEEQSSTGPVSSIQQEMAT